ncbi:MAG: L-fucose:H+ symporter permease [Phenylobacterium sp.]
MPGEEGAQGRRAALPIFLIVSLFFLWGAAHNLNDVLVAQFRKAFQLGDLQSGLVQSAFYLGYFFFAFPAALVMRRYGYKAGVVLGLILFGGGALLFWPAAELKAYGAFLAALFVIASGLAFLETSANPLVLALGRPETGAGRLLLAQAFNPAGSIVGVLISRQFIFSGVEPSSAELAAMSPTDLARFSGAEAHAVQLPYLVIGGFVLAWAVLIALTRFPPLATAPSLTTEGLRADLGRLLRRPRFLMGVMAQFFYVGAQVGVWSYLIRYAQAETGVGEKTAASYLILCLAAFAVGRFSGAALMTRFRPDRLAGVYAVINVALCLVGALAGGTVGLWALVAASFFMSVMYPTIFTLSVESLGPLTKLGSALLVMAIVGGAAITAVMGAVSDASSIAIAMAVPAACFAMVAVFAWTARRSAAASPADIAVAAPAP